MYCGWHHIHIASHSRALCVCGCVCISSPILATAQDADSFRATILMKTLRLHKGEQVTKRWVSEMTKPTGTAHGAAMLAPREER